MLKALVIRLQPGKDLGDLVQIARAEAKKIFPQANGNIRVVDTILRSYGWIAVVQDSEVVSDSKMKSA